MGKSEGNWETLSPMKIARSHAPAVSYNNKIYVFGGGGPNFSSLDNCVCYNPGEKSWVDIQPMPTKRSGTAAFLIDEKIYVVGGGFKKPDGNFQFLKTVEIYDPQTDTWESGPDLLQPHDYPASTLIDKTIYILGGHHPDACLGGPKTDPGFDFCEYWSPSDENWLQLPSLPTPRFAASALYLNEKIYTCGGVAFTPEGFNNFDFFENYSFDTGKWERDKNLTLPWPAAGHGMCNVDENIFFFGGYSTDNIHARAAICPANQTGWHRLPDMPVARAAMGVATLNNTIYLIGGWEDDGRTPSSSVVTYTWDE